MLLREGAIEGDAEQTQTERLQDVGPISRILRRGGSGLAWSAEGPHTRRRSTHREARGLDFGTAAPTDRRKADEFCNAQYAVGHNVSNARYRCRTPVDFRRAEAIESEVAGQLRYLQARTTRPDHARG